MQIIPRREAPVDSTGRYEATYDILLSPSYQVPVLYFSLRDPRGDRIQDLEEAYRLLVPERNRLQLRQVGILGGVSVSVGAYT